MKSTSTKSADFAQTSVQPYSKYCVRCGSNYPDYIALPVHCPCGNVIHGANDGSSPNPRVSHRTVYEPAASPVNWNAAICRSNKCGCYDAKRDACLKIIQIGEEKGLRRAGKVNWLHGSKHAACPADPPMFDGPTDPAEVMRILEDQEL